MEAKLTIKLPEELRRRAKAVAALRGETVSDVVRAALEEYIAEAFEEEEDIRVSDEVVARIKAGKEALYDLEEVRAEFDALEAKGELPG